MSYTARAIFSFGWSLGTSTADLTVQPRTATGVATGSPVVGTFTAEGNGVFTWAGVVPDDAVAGKAYKTSDASYFSIREFVSADSPGVTTLLSRVPALLTTAAQDTEDVQQLAGLMGDLLTAIGNVPGAVRSNLSVELARIDEAISAGKTLTEGERTTLSNAVATAVVNGAATVDELTLALKAAVASLLSAFDPGDPAAVAEAVWARVTIAMIVAALAGRSVAYTGPVDPATKELTIYADAAYTGSEAPSWAFEDYEGPIEDGDEILLRLIPAAAYRKSGAGPAAAELELTGTATIDEDDTLTVRFEIAAEDTADIATFAPVDDGPTHRMHVLKAGCRPLVDAHATVIRASGPPA